MHWPRPATALEAVAAAVEAVPDGLAPGCRHGAGITQRGQGGIQAEPVGVSPALTSSFPAVSTPRRSGPAGDALPPRDQRVALP
jgi:hypothetical protein